VQRGIADSRSDVYAAGIVAYEMLTGEKPFSADSPIQIAYMHVNEEIPRLRSKRKEIPQALDDLIASSTAKDPDERPRSAGEFLEKLQQIQVDLDPRKNQMDLGLDLPVEPIREKPRKKVKEVAPVEVTAPVVETTKEIRRKEEKKKRASKRVRRNRKVALVLAVALGIGGWWTLVGPGSRVVVPSTIGGSFDEAVGVIGPLGLTAVVVENRFDEEIPKGKIIESIPAGGGKVDAGGTVKLILSKGQERYAIPMTKGLTPEAAQTALKKYPLQVGTVNEVFNSEIPKGFVVSTSPVSGTSVKRDTKVDLLVSKGIEQIALASYLGKSGEQALNELTEAGFSVEAGYAFNETVPELAVISQSPAGGTTANKGGKVTILISKGPRYTVIPASLRGMPGQEAVNKLEALGLKVRVLPKGVKLTGKRVQSAIPTYQTKVKRGSLVTITVG
jgi:serine/threonine-protein kinase